MKYEEVYLIDYQDGRDARADLGNYFRFYNTERPQQTLGHKIPAEVFILTPVKAINEDMVESLTSDTLRYKSIEPTNNHLERQLRLMVIMRKLTFGNRSDFGAYF